MDNIHTSRARAAAAALAAILSTTACGAPLGQTPNASGEVRTYDGLEQGVKVGQVLWYAPGEYSISGANLRAGTNVGRQDLASRILSQKTIIGFREPILVQGERADAPSPYGPASTYWACSRVPQEMLGLRTDGILPRIWGCVYVGDSTGFHVGNAREKCVVASTNEHSIQCANGANIGGVLPDDESAPNQTTPPLKSKGGYGRGSASI